MSRQIEVLSREMEALGNNPMAILQLHEIICSIENVLIYRIMSGYKA